MRQTKHKQAVVLLSGGVDSATCLAVALSQAYQCHALSFDYGQKNRAELKAAYQVGEALGVNHHCTFKLPINQWGGSALTDDRMHVPTADKSLNTIPLTYVPARNTVFLSIGLAMAEAVGAEALFIGVNAVDYSGYPDCRPEYIEAFQGVAKLATKSAILGQPIAIKTPLIELTKAAIIRWGHRLGLNYSLTCSCYQPNLAGQACGHCDSCYLRRAGFIKAGLKDPTRYSATGLQAISSQGGV